MAEVTRRDYLKEIWEICEKLSDAAITEAQSAMISNEYEVNGGLIPLSESCANLETARGIIQDAIDKEKLVQLPISVQRELLVYFEAIKKAMDSMLNGVDEIEGFSNAVEDLNTAIWKYGFHNLSDEVLGYQRKLNQLKNQQTYLSKATREIEAGLANLEVINASTDLAKTAAQQAATSSAEIIAKDKAADDLLVSIRTTEALAKASAVSIDSFKTSTSKIADEVGEASARIGEIEDAVSTFATQIVEYEKRITATTSAAVSLSAQLTKDAKELAVELTEQIAEGVASGRKEIDDHIETVRIEVQGFGDALTERADGTIEENQRKAETLQSELKKMKESVQEQLEQATGLGLFGAFQSRQNMIAKGKQTWVWVMACLVLLSIGTTLFIANAAQKDDLHSVAFWIKLSITLPLWAALTFCILQYNRERRLEEEYAFKATVSVSLDPYRELVYGILEKDGNLEAGHYTDFVIDSVKRIFTSPTERVFQSEKKEGLTAKSLKDTAELIGTVVKASK